MKRKKPSRKDLLSSCNEIGPDDGLDPRIFFRKASEKKANRKTLQLCSEVAKTLAYALSWEMGDDLLSLLQVERVAAAPDSSRLLVTVSLQAPPDLVDPARVVERLQQSTGKLRAAVAAAVCRRRVPDLTFRLELRKEVDQ
jgi:ribosome-binding factor A